MASAVNRHAVIFPHVTSRSPRAQRKRDAKKAGQTSIDTHPDRVPKVKTSKIGVQIIDAPYTAQPKGKHRHLCRQIESKMALTDGRRGYGSSTRVGFVAPLGNTQEGQL